MNYVIAQFHRWDPNSLSMLFLCCLIGVVLLTCAVCEIRELWRARNWPKRKPHIGFRANPSIAAGGAYAAPVEPQHTRRVMP